MTAFIRVIALALALAGSSWSSHPSGSAGNQYGAREDGPQPQPLAEATDHPPEAAANATGPIPPPKRLRRSYTRWSGQVIYSVPYQSISVWKPPVYQLQRPYYIPIYGVAGRVPIYYPPQPLYVNPGAPQDNKPPFAGPAYLPPPTSTPMTVEDRFNDKGGFNGADNFDDRPVWMDGDGTQRPEVVPTRRPKPPGAPKTPPLVHNPTDPQGSEAAAPPPKQAEPDVNRVPPGVRDPGRCVWAIISCCTSTNQIIEECFEQRGCPGPFWDANPCDSDWARAAIAAALNYYN